MTTGKEPAPNDYQKVLLLQGGGALGAYQAGAYEALAAGNHAPDWVVGVSIGAINASIIAGNAPQHRVERLRRFWHLVTMPTAPFKGLRIPNAVEQRIGAAGAVLAGQPGFFRPWWPLDWVANPPTSFYDTSGLEKTLRELVDFDLLNRGEVRLSLGAVHVETGNNLYFDNMTTKIGPQHVMASGALPPGFPAISINGKAYWDGGLVSNTPLTYFMDHQPRRNSLVFQVDLFSARGTMPRTIDEVSEREKDIRYSSRTRLVTTTETRQQNLRREATSFLAKLPPELRDDPVAERMRAWACPARIDLVHLIYRPEEPQGSQKDYQFARSVMEQRWANGRADAGSAVAAAPGPPHMPKQPVCEPSTLPPNNTRVEEPAMNIDDVRKTAFAMPLTNPAFPVGPYRFTNREYMIITYRTDRTALERVVPAPLQVADDVVKYEFIRMPDSTGFGDYTESGQVIPVVFEGRRGSYTHAMFLNDHPPIAGGRELWGFPKKLASPCLEIDVDTLVGTLDYGKLRIAVGTMGYKHRVLDHAAILATLQEPSFLLKTIPHVDGSLRVCELVRYYFEDVTLKGAWTGPAALALYPHALAPIAELPVREVISATHLVADLTLGLGTVVHDYLA